jgi:hypothetical protein
MVTASGQAFAGPSGTVLAVIQQAEVDSQTGKAVLAPAAPIYPGDKINTGPVGQAQIRFMDDTKLVVGPNSSMVIDAFVFDQKNTAKQVTINVTKGVFRFFTGSSPKDAYSIITPTATIGVRGTQFDISIEKEGTTRVANFEGSTRICHHAVGQTAPDPNSCVVQTDLCSLSIARPNEPDVQTYNNQDTEFRNRQLKYYFQYVRDQSPLLDDFKVDLSSCQFADAALPRGGFPEPGPIPTPPIVIPPDEPPAPPPLPTFTPPNPPTLPADRHDSRPDHDRPSH